MKSLAILAAAAALAASPIAAAQPSVPLDHLPVLAGDYFPVASREAGHSYHIYIRYPEGYAETPGTLYPVLYVLDGDSLFPHLAANQLFLHYDDKIPEVIVVGIAYGSFGPPQNRRRHDFTDGAAAFGRFLANELIPLVETKVRGDPARRMLFGQSRGGGYVLHSAFTDPDLFWARIASNPTVDSLPSLQAAPAKPKRSDLHLLIASGSQDDPKWRTPRTAWSTALNAKQGLPWALRIETIEGGTHAADSSRVHRMAMRWLFTAP